DTSVAQDLALPVSKENNTSQSPATAQTKQTIFSSQDVASSSLNKSNAPQTQEAEEINQAVSTSSTPSASSQRDVEPSADENTTSHLHKASNLSVYKQKQEIYKTLNQHDISKDADSLMKQHEENTNTKNKTINTIFNEQTEKFNARLNKRKKT
ncbi:hypothetical protein, partial [Holospora curviuscula]|uniref:hypothetical protein n=1 Tax=Holospora curviuscula TaxID=1082868 RepID=UPI0013FE0269